MHKKTKQRTKPKAPLQALIEKQMECNHNNKTTTKLQHKGNVARSLKLCQKKRKKPKVHQKFQHKKNLEVHNFVNPKPSSLPFSRKDESFLSCLSFSFPPPLPPQTPQQSKKNQLMPNTWIREEMKSKSPKQKVTHCGW